MEDRCAPGIGEGSHQGVSGDEHAGAGLGPVPAARSTCVQQIEDPHAPLSQGARRSAKYLSPSGGDTTQDSGLVFNSAACSLMNARISSAMASSFVHLSL